jgi:ferredoxin-NADP reductase
MRGWPRSIYELKNGIHLDFIYQASMSADLILNEELDNLVSKSEGDIRVHYLVDFRRECPMGAKFLPEPVPGMAASHVYICDPLSLVDAVRKAGDDSVVPKNRFRVEVFTFHSQ